MKVLKSLLYTNEHEWVRVKGKKAYIGITDYAQSELGAIVYVELPDVDTEFGAGDNFAVIESVKAASDVYLPIDGTVIEVNEGVIDEPALLNEAPYDNWLVCVEISDSSQLDELMDADEYRDFCSEEE
jgi:glycine cleavage system H protein